MEAESNPTEVQEPVGAKTSTDLATEVKAELDAIVLQGLLGESELDSRAMDAIKDLSTADALSVLQDFKSSDLPNIANKSAHICILIKSRRQHKGRAGRHEEGGSGDDSRGANKPGPDPEKMKEILERTKYSHEVSSGQRRYGGPPPNWTGTQPGAGHEIYCGKLPKDLYEDSLIPLFEKYGTIWDLRLMMDPISGRNRGYCFVTYTDKKHAEEAIAALDKFELRPNRPLRCNASVANTRLFIGNIPKNRSREEIKQEFEKHTEGLLDVIVYSTPDDTIKKNRGFAFLDYDSHKSASAAKRLVGGGRLRVWGSEVYVEWAEPQDEPDDDTMAKVKVLYVRNLKADITEPQLKEAFEPYGVVERTKRVKSYGFVHFAERDAAVKAMEALNGTKLGDLEMDISLAKPSSKNRRNNLRRFPQYHQNGAYANGGGYNDYWNQPYVGYYGNGPQGARPMKDYDFYNNYENFYEGDQFYNAYEGQGYGGFYGGYGNRYMGNAAYSAGPQRRGGDGYYGSGSHGGYGSQSFRGGNANRRGAAAAARR